MVISKKYSPPPLITDFTLTENNKEIHGELDIFGLSPLRYQGRDLAWQEIGTKSRKGGAGGGKWEKSSLLY